MIAATKVWTWARALINSMLLANQARPAAALMTTATLHLATAVGSVNPDNQTTDFTEAAFTGYAAVAVTLGTAGLNVGSNVQGLLQSALFEMTAVTAGAETVIAVYLTDGGGTTFYGAEMLAAPANFVNPGDFLDYNLILPAPCIVTVSG